MIMQTEYYCSNPVCKGEIRDIQALMDSSDELYHKYDCVDVRPNMIETIFIDGKIIGSEFNKNSKGT